MELLYSMAVEMLDEYATSIKRERDNCFVQCQLKSNQTAACFKQINERINES